MIRTNFWHCVHEDANELTIPWTAWLSQKIFTLLFIRRSDCCQVHNTATNANNSKKLDARIFFFNEGFCPLTYNPTIVEYRSHPEFAILWGIRIEE